MKIDDILEVSTALHDVVLRENDALRANDLKRAAGCLTVKRECVAAFDALRARHRQGIAIRPDDRLAAMVGELEKALEENRQLLKHAVSVQNRLISLLAGALRDEVSAPQGYHVNGLYAASSSRHPPRAIQRRI